MTTDTLDEQLARQRQYVWVLMRDTMRRRDGAVLGGCALLYLPVAVVKVSPVRANLLGLDVISFLEELSPQSLVVLGVGLIGAGLGGLYLALARSDNPYRLDFTAREDMLWR